MSINISIQNYVTKQIPTESTAGGVLLYIKKKHFYKTHLDLMIYKERKFESTFIEVIMSNKTNLIVVCIYRHGYTDSLCMDICTFNDHYISLSLDNLSKEANKAIVLLGDFNIDLFNFNSSNYINTFFDNLASNSLQPQTFLPTRVCKNSKTLIDNIFYNTPNPLAKSAISGNISFSISDHLQQFFLLPDFFSNSTPTV